ncbi:hypothetical protein, partial [Pseudomonas syringae group genomosp. 7]|uniref:hypothetical protein n=1 Tax=Pseudomonas syringae group genomosp. 7 TaxID=251699 RepID=UPI0037704394
CGCLGVRLCVALGIFLCGSCFCRSMLGFCSFGWCFWLWFCDFVCCGVWWFVGGVVFWVWGWFCFVFLVVGGCLVALFGLCWVWGLAVFCGFGWLV